MAEVISGKGNLCDTSSCWRETAMPTETPHAVEEQNGMDLSGWKIAERRGRWGRQPPWVGGFRPCS